MARVTVNKILDAVCEKHNIKREYLQLEKSHGTYYWCGKFPCMWSVNEMNSHMVYLNDWTLERWIESFDHIMETEDFSPWGNKPINEMIESIEWLS